MNALNPVDNVSPRRPRRKRDPQHIERVHKAMAAEVTIKLVANSVLSIAAIAGLVKLLPYQSVQQEKLKEVRLEVQATEERVNQLRADFGRNFDPSQTRRVMQEQSPKVDPNHRRIFWVKQ